MTLLSLFLLLPCLLSGGILAHLLWPDRKFKSILLKLFLGIGLGLGLNSLLFFIFLLVFNQHAGFIWFQLLATIILIVLLIHTERSYRNQLERSAIVLAGRSQAIFLALTGIVVVLASIIYITFSVRKPHGAWDSWMIYNRAARFIYRGEDHWRDAFSPEMYWFFHTDYPPLLALNVSSGWSALGQETLRFPILVGGAFLFGSAGLLFAGVNAYKTLGQATLALMVLFSLEGFIKIGSGQIADVPLSFFILATGVLVLLYSDEGQKGMLVLAGLSAGLAAWTKNEGIVFMLGSLLGMGLAYRNEMKRIFPPFLLGLAVPLAILIYFKIALAPPGDILAGISSRFGQIIDFNRHSEILKQLGIDLGGLVNWVLLAVYALVLGLDRPTREASLASLAFLTAILLQLIGYYFIFLVSPHSVLWHVSALSRLLLQIGPLIVFLYFIRVRSPETVFKTT